MEICRILGKDETLRRLNAGLAMLGHDGLAGTAPQPVARILPHEYRYSSASAIASAH